MGYLYCTVAVVGALQCVKYGLFGKKANEYYKKFFNAV